MARTNKKAKAAAAAKELTLKEVGDKLLEDAKGRFEGIIILGVTGADTPIDISTNVPQYAWLHHMLQKTGFELLLHEKNAIEAKNKDVAV